MPGAEQPAPKSEAGEGWLLPGAILAGIAARAWLHFSTPLVPGINGAYYLVQARALLEKGALGIPDLPLTFHLHAGVAWMLARLAALPLESAIVLAVKVLDSVLPPLAAVPVFFLVRKWSVRSGRGPLAAGAAALVVAVGAPALFMTGDFQKNSLGLVWMAALLWALREWLDDPAPRRALLVLLLLGLCGLTHIGVLATALLVAGLVVGTHFIRRRDRSVLRALPWVLGAVLVIGAVCALVAWKFDPARVQKLVTSFTQPLGPPGGSDSRPPLPGQGPPGGGALFAVLRWLPPGFFALVAFTGLGLAWRRRATLPAADTMLVCGTALAVLLLTGPWVTGDRQMRFGLNAVIPAVLVGAFALIHLPQRRTRIGLGTLAVVVLTGAAVPQLAPGGRGIVPAEALPELRSLAAHIPQPARTLIVAMHGPEWWTAWTLHTRIAQAQAVQPADWQRYDVLFLEAKSVRIPGPGGPGGPGGPPRGGAPPPGLGRPVIPPEAEILHDGPHWKLARVAPPASASR